MTTISSTNSSVSPFNSGDVTGDYHLLLEFDDSADTLTGSFSIDDDVSFTTIGTLSMPRTGWAGVTGFRVDPVTLTPAVPVPALSGTSLILLGSLLIAVAYWRFKSPRVAT